jgi:uncharacterized protein DUF4114/PEP-CTERM motif-containing protein
MKLKNRLIALLSTLLLTGTVQAGLLFDESLLDTEILGGRFLVATDGAVEATFLGSDAGYFNILYLDSPDSWGTGSIFDKSTDYGTQISLGEFNAGTELIFRLFVSNTGLSFYNGEGSRNSETDGLPHAMAITTLLDNDLYLTTVGFEDLRGGGDLDYNDFMFSLSNVIDPPGIPEPSVLLLLAIGLIGFSLARRRRVKLITVCR